MGHRPYSTVCNSTQHTAYAPNPDPSDKKTLSVSTADSLSLSESIDKKFSWTVPRDVSVHPCAPGQAFHLPDPLWPHSLPQLP